MYKDFSLEGVSMQRKPGFHVRRPLLVLVLVTVVCIPWWFGLWRIGELIGDMFK